MEGCRVKRQPDFYGGCCAGTTFKTQNNLWKRSYRIHETNKKYLCKILYFSVDYAYFFKNRCYNKRG